jgi:pyruvate/2-oxoglutarate dehydrogenase complex dihydrolipoamide dehydrogenase (E3) component
VKGFVQVDDKMRVLKGPDSTEIIEGLWCIGDATGKMMLAHAASTQVRKHLIRRAKAAWVDVGCIA